MINQYDEDIELMRKKKGPFKIDREKFYYLQLGTTKPSFIKKIRFWVFSFGLHCITVYRYGQFSLLLYKKNKLLGLPFIMLYYPMYFLSILLHHVDINRQTKIGPGFFIAHASNIYIGRTEIGENFSITHNVTIGRGFTQGLEGKPVIGNNVWIGTGSIITGLINIGDGAAISAGSVLSKDVPENSVAAGNPARIILRDQDNSKLIRYKISHDILKESKPPAINNMKDNEKTKNSTENTST